MTLAIFPGMNTQRLTTLLLILLCALLTACGETPTATVPAPTATVVAPTATVVAPTATTAPAATATAAATATPRPTVPPTLGPDQFANPVIRRDFPDPDVLKVGDTYYVYATNAASSNIQAAKSTDLVDWQPLHDALPGLPTWASVGNTWAPEVTTWDGGKSFVMYFAARYGNDRQCIGAATSATPEGPFKPVGTEPFICDLGEGGDIDPSSFLAADGTKYILWKNDGNCCGGTTHLYIQTLSADGLQREGERTALIENDQPWEGSVIEAPTLWQNGAKYYLFYSANSYIGLDYAVGYAVADNILGPYTKPPGNPILASQVKQRPVTIGPGGQDIVVGPDNQTWIVYHSWDAALESRYLNIDEISFDGGVPKVAGPDMGPQEKP